MQSIVVDAYHSAKRLLLENYPKLVQIARYLMLNESIEGPDLQQLFASESPPLDGAVPVGA